MLNRSTDRDNACSQGAMKTKSQITEISENSCWHPIYFVLAGVSVVVATATLLVSAMIFEIYVSSIDKHSAWAKFHLSSLGDRTNVGLRGGVMD
ncbi:MAG: hypothetical protein ACI9TP_002435 [Candidatus Azotimanducaceae bacterium]|jgi:hypothetical protein